MSKAEFHFATGTISIKPKETMETLYEDMKAWLAERDIEVENFSETRGACVRYWAGPPTSPKAGEVAYHDYLGECTFEDIPDDHRAIVWLKDAFMLRRAEVLLKHIRRHPDAPETS